MSEAKSMLKTASAALATASNSLRKVESESKMLKDKIAQLEKRLQDTEKEAMAGKLAMDLVLDEDTVKLVKEKTASLKTKNLSVVEEAISLGLGEKIANIGTIADKDSSSKESKSPTQAFYSFLSKSK